MHVVMVTGYSRGIGAAMVRDLLRRRREGTLPAGFVFIGRQQPAPADLAAGDVFVKADLSVALTGEALDELGRLIAPHSDHGGRAGLVYAAGSLGPLGFGSLKEGGLPAFAKDLSGTLHVNATNFALLSTVLEGRMQHGSAGGAVLHLSSGAALHSYAALGAYCASKAAALMHARCLAARYQPERLCVLSVAPGTVRTAMTETLAGSDAQRWPELTKFKDLDRSGGLVEADPVGCRLVALMLDDEHVAWRSQAHGCFYDLRKPNEFLRW